MTKVKELLKKTHKGKNVMGKGKNFKKVENKAAKEYGSKKAGERVAGAVFWNKIKKMRK